MFMLVFMFSCMQLKGVEMGFSSFYCTGAGNGYDGNYNTVAEVGWYILGEDQQQVGPYVFSELRGEFGSVFH